MRTVWLLLQKEYRLFWSDRVAVALTFLIPIILIALWGAIFGNADSGPTNLRLAFLNNSPAPIARRIERVLDTTRVFSLVRSFKDDQGKVVPFDTASIRQYVRKGNAAAALIIPEDAYTDTSSGLRLIMEYDPRNDMEMQLIQGVLLRTLFGQMPEVMMQSGQRSARRFLGNDSGKAFNNDIARTVGRYFHVDVNKVLNVQLNDSTPLFGGGEGGGENFFDNILRLEKRQVVGEDIANPWATRSVGGWAMMFLLFMVNASSTSLFDEKQSGVMLRLLASPVSRAQILWSKYLHNFSLGTLQLCILFVTGALLFRIDIVTNAFNLVVVMLASAAACTAFGMLLASVSKTPGQARGLGTLLILAMSSVGGAWFPTSFMSPAIQTLGKASIVTWSMDGFLQVLWRRAGLGDIAADLGVLMAMAAVITIFSLWRFNKGDLF